MKQSLFSLCVAVLCLMALAGCGRTNDAQDPSPAQTMTASVPAESAPETPPGSERSSESAETSDNQPADTPDDTMEPAPQATPYVFGEAVTESDPVEESWFEDAVFLGDSRTEGLQIYSGLRAGDFFWSRGMNVFSVDDPEKRVIEVNGEKLTLMEALALKSYTKVYIMIGVNELGYPVSSYDEGLRQMIDKVKEIQPNAVIYLQTLPPVNEKVAADNGLGSYIKNAKVNAFNNVIVQTAWDKQVALLDVASVFRTEQGDLAADMASDGVHFYKQGYVLWYDYLKVHTLDPASYAIGQRLPEPPDGQPVPEPAEAPSPEPAAAPEPTEPPAVASPGLPDVPAETEMTNTAAVP